MNGAAARTLLAALVGAIIAGSAFLGIAAADLILLQQETRGDAGLVWGIVFLGGAPAAGVAGAVLGGVSGAVGRPFAGALLGALAGGSLLAWSVRTFSGAPHAGVLILSGPAMGAALAVSGWAGGRTGRRPRPTPPRGA